MNSVILELLRGFRIAYDLAKLVEVKTYGRKHFAFVFFSYCRSLKGNVLRSFVFVYCKRLKEKFLCSLLIYSGLQWNFWKETFCVRVFFCLSQKIERKHFAFASHLYLIAEYRSFHFSREHWENLFVTLDLFCVALKMSSSMKWHNPLQVLP
jgi:hypothetical protein